MKPSAQGSSWTRNCLTFCLVTVLDVLCHIASERDHKTEHWNCVSYKCRRNPKFSSKQGWKGRQHNKGKKRCLSFLQFLPHCLFQLPVFSVYFSSLSCAYTDYSMHKNKLKAETDLMKTFLWERKDFVVHRCAKKNRKAAALRNGVKVELSDDALLKIWGVESLWELLYCCAGM